MDLSHRPVSTAPYVQRRVVKWGDCDPAGIIYTPRFLDFVLEAVEGWQREVLGVDWYKLKTERGMGMPVVHASLDFHHKVKPNDELDIEVAVARIGRSSIEFKLTGRITPGDACFTCTLITAFIDNERFKARSIPPDFRRRIEAYIQASAGVREC